jgi:hypothetical protein
MRSRAFAAARLLAFIDENGAGADVQLQSPAAEILRDPHSDADLYGAISCRSVSLIARLDYFNSRIDDKSAVERRSSRLSTVPPQLSMSLVTRRRFSRAAHK